MSTEAFHSVMLLLKGGLGVKHDACVLFLLLT